MFLRWDVSAETRKAREECARLTEREMREAFIEPSERWEAWVADFFKHRYGTRLLTKSRYETTWRTWLLFLKKRDISVPRLLTYSHMMDFFNWRQDPAEVGTYQCGRNTALMDMKVMGTIMQEAIRRGFAVVNPAHRLGLKKARPKEKPEITLEEEARIRAEVQQPGYPDWMRIGFEIAMATGCRFRETQVDFHDIDFQNETITFNAKGDKRHTTLLSPELASMLRDLKARGLPRTCEIPPRAQKFWWRLFRRLKLKHLCFHCIRVTVITRLARAGIPERHTMRYVGHASSTVHAIYTKLKVDDLRPCLAALSGMAASPGGPGAILKPTPPLCGLQEKGSPRPSGL